MAGLIDRSEVDIHAAGRISSVQPFFMGRSTYIEHAIILLVFSYVLS